MKLNNIAELSVEDKAKVMKSVGNMASFFRRHPHIFVKMYFDIELTRFQKMALCEMFKGDYSMLLAARGSGKTFLTSIFCVAWAILYPGSKIVVAAGVKNQAYLVIKKITLELMGGNGWGAKNISREIKKIRENVNDTEIVFFNSSSITAVPASDNARGYRATVLIIDEFRLVDENIISTVLKKFLAVPRMPNFLTKKEYRGQRKLYGEANKEIYMSSAWYKSHWSYEKALSYFEAMLEGKKYFMIALPYQVPVMEGYGNLAQLQDEADERGFNEAAFAMEMECIFYGNRNDGFFSVEEIQKQRLLEHPMYKEQETRLLRSRIPDVPSNGKRILSVDVALMKGNKNDATSIIVNDAYPVENGKSYEANIIHLETHEGLKTQELALLIRKLFEYYKCTDIALDTNGVGLGCFDALSSDIIDSETGKLYKALSCINDDKMAERCTVPNAPKVIWSIKASAKFNTEIHTLVRSGFNNGKIKLLCSVDEAKDIIQSRFEPKVYNGLADLTKRNLLMPYVETDLLINELLSLKAEIKGNSVTLVEASNMRKDRYSSLAYNIWVMSQLELMELRKPKMDTSISDYFKGMKKVSKRPIMY